ncbi:hydroxymethylpyrimidine/phosphomethylpyrimidine kinase [Pullulanibacillus camelliae]|uniref:Hydroxymethylpyrimidine/phosphomethylpyrimidine kinase n=1 Tax=Pullulanibacillus camelliae TaxID=1707096 RepID=A0A8J3E006_9BACL|nr:bifunctional hydroxymethylpyrimidine kinase/phosphomethylpyrimidine kinase [Pullulanibacillus camelliae]GGE52921.1 hydroxymethylpyrimidine/phosphomethylpyrimidine kinase [Pullulanibacillus camelliae]
MKTALTIAGSDSSGGAGIQADLKTFSALGVYGMSVLTAVTAQNTQEVSDVEELSPKIIAGQIDAIFQDIDVDSIKIGMLSNEQAIRVIAERLNVYRPYPVVLDPVMVSKSGYDLLRPAAKNALLTELLPMATLITPNLKETEALLGYPVTTLREMEEAAKALVHLGPRAALVKGGHLEGEAVDVLFDGTDLHHFSGERVQTKNTHGTGCTLSSAIAAFMAKGRPLAEAVTEAKCYIQRAIAEGLSIGHGHGPTHHFHEWYTKEGIKK